MVHKDIGRFDVPVHDIWLMEGIEGTQDIINYCYHMILSKLNLVRQIENTPEIVFSHLHNDENVFQI